MLAITQLISERILELDREFAEGKITGEKLFWLLSIELEFFTEFSPGKLQTEKLRAGALEYVRERKGEFAKCDEAQIAEMLALIEEFSPQFVCIFHLHNELADIIEFNYGQYHDNPGVCEIRLKPARPEQFLQNYERARKAVRNMGFKFHNDSVLKIESEHPNFSINRMKDGRLESVFAHIGENEVDMTITRKVFSGILKIFDLTRLTHDKHALAAKGITLGTSRNHTIRISKNRAEHRTSAENVLMRIVKIMGGAKAGLQMDFSATAHFPKITRGGDFRRKIEGDNSVRYTRLVLQGAEITQDGHIIPDAGFITGRMQVEITNEMLGTNLRHGQRRPGVLTYYQNAITSALERVVVNGSEIDLSGLDKWEDMPDTLAETVDNGAGTRLARLRARFEGLKCEGFFATIKAESASLALEQAKWRENVTALANSQAVVVAMGAKLHREVTPLALINAFMPIIGAVSRSDFLGTAARMREEFAAWGAEVKNPDIHAKLGEVLNTVLRLQERVTFSPSKYVRQAEPQGGSAYRS